MQVKLYFGIYNQQLGSENHRIQDNYTAYIQVTDHTFMAGAFTTQFCGQLHSQD